LFSFTHLVRLPLALLAIAVAVAACGGGAPGANSSPPPPTPGTVGLSAATYGIAQNAGSVTVAVNRTGGAGGAASVAYTTANGTATSGADYTANSGTLNWADGDSAAKAVAVTVSNAAPFKGSKTFTLALSNASGASLGTPATATVAITGSGTVTTTGAVAFSANAYGIAQSGGSVTITVIRTGGSSGAASVAYSTTNGTAVSGADYTANSGTLNWADGDSAAKTVAVTVSNAAPFAGSKTFTLALSNASGASLGTPATATVTITGSGTVATTGTLAFSANAYSIAQSGGSATITMIRTGGSSGAASVAYATANGTAVSGTDYTANTGTLTWADGDGAAKTFAVSVSNTKAFSGSKTFTIILSGATGATLGTPTTATVTITGSATGGASTVTPDHHITVDQFGYRPNDPKVAVIRTPHTGFDSNDTFTPGTSYQLRKASDGAVVLTANITAWNSGATEASSGDSGWWFDFSTVTTPDTYFVYDVAKNVRSPTFVIGQQVYKNILKAAVRMYFYQRSGTAKLAQFAGSNWADGAAYVGAGQDLLARDVTDKTNTAKMKDLSGGWFDAGDTNEYVTYAVTPVHQLLMAYQNYPAVFTDDFNIPESGNGVPDVVDEVKWEIDWFKKMQYPDGSVALKLGTIAVENASPPSLDTTPRYYVPACTSSTIAVAGMFAHAAYVYATIPALANQAADLKTRAVNAWNNYQSIATKQTHCDTGEIRAGNADRDLNQQNALAVVASAYLYAITGSAAYHDYFKAHYNNSTYMRPYFDMGWSRYDAEQGEALLFYTTLPGADATVKSAILASKQADVNAGNQIYGFNANDDLYRDFLHDGQYHWGSHQPRGNYGNTNNDAITYGLAGANSASYRTRALEVLHYFHGVNPFGRVFLTNMYSYGATWSENEIFHAWFRTGSIWSDAKTSPFGPAPGYLPGGANANTSVTLSPPAGQPRQKAFRDWNGNGRDPQTSWEITEPGIYYQSAYVKLVAAFAQ
jgi:hypothetical protein